MTKDAEPDAMDVDTSVPSTANNAGPRRSGRRPVRRQGLRRYPRRARRAVSRYVPPLATSSLRNGTNDDHQPADPETESLLQRLRRRMIDKERSRATLAGELERARRANPLGQPGAVARLVGLEKNLRKACNDFKSKSENCMAQMNWEDESIQSSVRAMDAQLDALAGFVRPYDDPSKQ